MTASRPRRKDYKVMTKMDGFFSGVFNPIKLEAAINHYAETGWCVVAMTTASLPGGLVGHGDELIVLFEPEHIHLTEPSEKR